MVEQAAFAIIVVTLLALIPSRYGKYHSHYGKYHSH